MPKTVTTQFVTDIRLRYFLIIIPLQLWENKKMWDLKLSVSHDSQTAERNPEKRLECENPSSRPFTKISPDNKQCVAIKLVHSLKITLEQNPEFNI